MDEDPELLYSTRETQAKLYLLKFSYKEKSVDWRFFQVTLLQQTLAANDADVEEEGVGAQNAAGSAGVSCHFMIHDLTWYISVCVRYEKY